MNNFRLSKYNLFLEKQDKVIGLNLYKKQLFSISRENYTLLKKYETRLDTLKKNNDVLFLTMYKLGIIEDASLNIPNILLMQNRESVFSGNLYYLCINTTLNCNFSCSYCYETRSKKRMTNETKNCIIRFLENLIVKRKIPYLKIDWFGGEPLLAFNTVMKPIGEALRRFCAESDTKLLGGITTNGYLITSDVISFFKEFNVKQFQITLDGDRDTHDKIRYQNKTQSSYDIIVRNICEVVNEISDVRFLLRINYKKETLSDCIKIIDSFPVDLRKYLIVNLTRVWQDRDNSFLGEGLDEQNKVLKIFQNSGFSVPNEKSFYNLSYACHADICNQSLINYDGRVFKCSATNFEKAEAEGILSANGEIIWDINRLAKRLSKATFDNEICLNCEYIPACKGGCSENVFFRNQEFEKCKKKPLIKQEIESSMKKFSDVNIKIGNLADF